VIARARIDVLPGNAPGIGNYGGIYDYDVQNASVSLFGAEQVSQAGIYQGSPSRYAGPSPSLVRQRATAGPGVTRRRRGAGREGEDLRSG